MYINKVIYIHIYSVFVCIGKSLLDKTDDENKGNLRRNRAHVVPHSKFLNRNDQFRVAEENKQNHTHTTCSIV